jgi:hypothetical protein
VKETLQTFVAVKGGAMCELDVNGIDLRLERCAALFDLLASVTAAAHAALPCRLGKAAGHCFHSAASLQRTEQWVKENREGVKGGEVIA